MASAISSSSSAVSSSLPASATPGLLTAPNAAVTTSLRSTAGVMAALPRLFVKLASFGYLDAHVVNAADHGSNVPPIEALSTVASAASATAAEVASVAASQLSDASVTAATGAAETTSRGVAHDGLRSMGNMFNYVTSKWAVLCLFMTIVVNRTMIYASLRRPVILPFRVRLTMRIVPILLLGYQIMRIMAAMRCQTSVEFRGEKADVPATDFFFHAVGKMGTWWMDDRDTCEAIGMIPDSDWIDLAASIQDPENPEVEIEPPNGSLEILWPLYKIVSLSEFVEAFSCALIGRATATETGMTLLEHSLAFAEAEALAIRKVYRLEVSPEEGDTTTETKIFKIRGRPIIPAEVLYICLISSLSHLVSHLLAIFHLQSRYRLLSTGFFGLAFLGGFAFSLIVGGSQTVLEYPTVSVIGLIPHLLIFSGITVCGFIYGLALLVSSLFPPSGRRSLRNGFNNLRANLNFSSVNVSLGEDFYTTLLKVGFVCLTAASEATYLNEGRQVRIPGWTWLEAERLKLRDSRNSILGATREAGFSPANNPPGCTGPFAREKKDFRGMVAAGKSKRSSSATARWLAAGEMMKGVGIVLGRVGFGYIGRLLGLSSSQPSSMDTDEAAASAQLLEDAKDATEYDEDDADELYHQFLSSGTPFPDTDTSGEFQPRSRESSPSSSIFDLPSSSRESSLAPSDSDEYESDASILTVTQRRHNLSFSRSNYSHHQPPSIADIFPTPTDLARLLDPQTPEDRAAARMLARHLRSDQVLTRGGFRRSVGEMVGSTEELELEELILARRRRTKPSPTTIEGGADGEEEEETGNGGMMCVVCYSQPRTIIVWPCRCLSLCEDCRVCLAMKNWGNCITCRQKSEGFSRIYIP
ncbi:hypothetical protein EX30DRAFT_341183 [Ascodesmis nigricans]|uniref:RING-type domain-containing protein n=1 Tax=Ascodesmis nigricans TaxID=341454 RepID=A0A4S2MWC4_9PEZI|nr:hypothetical protein EX30DRAFT_341183 [Ascodesmis nigricans]